MSTRAAHNLTELAATLVARENNRVLSFSQSPIPRFKIRSKPKLKMIKVCRGTTFERRGNNVKHVNDFYLKAKARIWPCLSYVCNIRSTADGQNNYLTVMCSSSEAGSYLRLIDFVYHSTLGLRAIKRRRRMGTHRCLNSSSLTYYS